MDKFDEKAREDRLHPKSGFGRKMPRYKNCGDCGELVENPPDHMISEIPDASGKYLVWHTQCYYKNRTMEGSGHECAAHLQDSLMAQLSVYDTCYCDDVEDPVMDLRVRCLHCTLEAARAALAQPCPAPQSSLTREQLDVAKEIGRLAAEAGIPIIRLDSPDDWRRAVAEVKKHALQSVAGSEDTRRLRFLLKCLHTEGVNFLTAGIDFERDCDYIDRQIAVRAAIESEETRAVPDQKIAEEMPGPPRCEVCGNYIRPHESIHYNSNHDLVHDGCRPRKIAKE